MPIKRKNQYPDKIWDEILKAIVQRMPHQLLPLIKDVFNTTYPANVEIKLLPTEKTIPKDIVKGTVTSIRSDIAVLIKNEVYHLEAQMKNDSFMSIRMIKYDFHLALSNSITEINDNEFEIHFPKSAVIYPEPNSNIPDKLICHVFFADGSKHDYKVPTIKVSDYDMKQIREKHLTILLPFKMLQMRPRLASKTNPLTISELTDFMNDIILILQNEYTSNRLTKEQHDDFIDLIDQAAKRVFRNNKSFRNQVISMTKSNIILPSERYEKLEKKLEKTTERLEKSDSELEAAKAEIQALKQKLQQYENM